MGTVIAIDGPSGTGKSTTARRVADHLGFLYLDTGAMYRALAWVALEAGIKPDDIQGLLQLLDVTTISFDSEGKILINGQSRDSEIRTMRVSEAVSLYCTAPEVRARLTGAQRSIGAMRDCVIDGRDIGTVVFPNTPYKFFLQADYRVRAERRLAELRAKGTEATLLEVEANLRERDQLDSTRQEAPLRQASDAISIDTTLLSISEQVQAVLSRVGVVARRDTEASQPSPKANQ